MPRRLPKEYGGRGRRVRRVKYINDEHQQIVASQILGLICGHGHTDWNTIVRSVSASWRVNDWMGIRGALQALLDEGAIVRTDDLSEEVYCVS